MKEQINCSKTIDIVSYALEVSINGVTCVFVVHFRSTFGNWLNGPGVTGNNLVLHKALVSHDVFI